MRGIIIWLWYKYILAYAALEMIYERIRAKIKRQPRAEWRGLRLSHTIEPDGIYGINEISQNLLNELKKNHDENLRGNK